MMSLQAYELRGAGAVLHSHCLNAVMATLIDEHATEFRVTHLEMIKVIALPAGFPLHAKTSSRSLCVWSEDKAQASSEAGGWAHE